MNEEMNLLKSINNNAEIASEFIMEIISLALLDVAKKVEDKLTHRSFLAHSMGKRNKSGYFDEIMTRSGISLSVQASRFHYCSPRKDNIPIIYYDSFEVCIYNGKFSIPHREVMLYMSDFARIDELCDAGDSTGVYGWVKASLIEELILFLNTNEIRNTSDNKPELNK